MNLKRRNFLRGAFAAAGAVSATAVSAEREHATPAPRQAAALRQAASSPLPAGPIPAGEYGAGVVAVATPDLRNMPWTADNGVKELKIAAELVRTEFLPGRIVDAWGFNGSTPGPTIEVNEGDRVRFIVENRLPEAFSMHWHGLEVPIEMDGVPGISQDPIAPGGTFTYEFTLHS